MIFKKDENRMRSAISGDQALKTAQADAEKIYKDLSGYRIILALEPDGWHVDYQLKKQLTLGGGPHYIIDLKTETIPSKKYQQ
jgi:hypothetical protein